MNRKLGIVGSALVVAGIVAYLAWGSFSDSLVYFYTPAEVVKLTPAYETQRIRVGGMVVKGSMKVKPQTTEIEFQLTDGEKTIPVRFVGVPPDLFAEGQGAVVEGFWRQAFRFDANLIMAKHSEDYMPVEMKRSGKEMPKEDLLKTLKQ